MSDPEFIERRLERERRARKAAEALLEERSLALYKANQELLQLTTTLEQRVRDRTEELARSLSLLNVQFDVMRNLIQCTTLEQAAMSILQTIGDALGWDAGAVWEADRRINGLRCIQFWHSPSLDAPEFKALSQRTIFPSGKGLPGRVWSSGEPVWISNLLTDPNFPRGPTAYKEGFRSGLGFPIHVSSDIRYVVEFFSREVLGTNVTLLQSLATIGNQIGQFAERARAEAELRESNRRLADAIDEVKRAQSTIIEQERLRALGTMASGIAHDFNNALSPILGFTELLLMDPTSLDDRDKIKRYLEMMNVSARDAANVVRRLREFYRNRDESETFLAVDLNHLVEQTVSLTRPKWKDLAMAGGKTIEIETNLQASTAINGNESELRESLTNLIFNAVDATPCAGVIRIRTWMELAENGRGQVAISVEDTGTGMTEEVRQRCLEPFFSTKGEQGTGLGLAMIHGIVRRHEGTIDIQSHVGKGTAFVLRFPEREGCVAEPQPSSTQLIDRRLHVLVVDDEEQIRFVLHSYLSSDGHTVEVAANGRHGLELFNRGWFDVVITDRAMPEMSGDQLAAAIKRLVPMKTTVIMLTGFGDFMRAAGELPEGVDMVLSKPISLAALRNAFAKVPRR